LIVEAAYRLVARRWLSIEPDLQWISRPAGRRDLRDALVIGVRVKIGR
jgi:porin